MIIFLYIPFFLQCSDAVDWDCEPVKGKENPFRKPVSKKTYTVFSGTLNPTFLRW